MKFALIAIGLAIAITSFAIFQNLLAYGCAMQTTGCNGFSVDYFSSEAAYIFWPIMIAGVGLILVGLRNRK